MFRERDKMHLSPSPNKSEGENVERMNRKICCCFKILINHWHVAYLEGNVGEGDTVVARTQERKCLQESVGSASNGAFQKKGKVHTTITLQFVHILNIL